MLLWPELSFYLTDLCNSDRTENCPSNPEANPEEKQQQWRLRGPFQLYELQASALFVLRSCTYTQTKQIKVRFEFLMENNFRDWVK